MNNYLGNLLSISCDLVKLTIGPSIFRNTLVSPYLFKPLTI